MTNKPQKPQAEAPAIFMPDELIAGAANFWTSPEIMAGALYGVTEGLTRDEAQERLEKFLQYAPGEAEGVEQKEE